MIKTDVQSVIQIFIKDGASFSTSDVVKMLRAAGNNYRHGEVAEVLRSIKPQFTFGMRIPGQTEDYSATLLQTDFAPNGVFVYHPQSVNPHAYKFDVYPTTPTAPVAVVQAQDHDMFEDTKILSYYSKFDGNKVYRELNVSVGEDEFPEDVQEYLETTAIECLASDVESLDKLTVNGIDINIAKWQEEIVDLFPGDDEDNDDDHCDMCDLEYVGDVTCESQGRLRIPSGVVSRVSDKMVLTRKSSDTFSMWV